MAGSVGEVFNLINSAFKLQVDFSGLCVVVIVQQQTKALLDIQNKLKLVCDVLNTEERHEIRFI